MKRDGGCGEGIKWSILNYKKNIHITYNEYTSKITIEQNMKFHKSSNLWSQNHNNIITKDSP